MEHKPQNPGLSLDERVSAMLDLANTYGGTANIPEESLSSIGYKRQTAEDGTVNVFPIEKENEISERRKVVEKVPPFDQIAVKLSTSEQKFRFISMAQIPLLTSRLNDIDNALNFVWKIAETTSPVTEYLPAEYNNPAHTLPDPPVHFSPAKCGCARCWVYNVYRRGSVR